MRGDTYLEVCCYSRADTDRICVSKARPGPASMKLSLGGLKPQAELYPSHHTVARLLLQQAQVERGREEEEDEAMGTEH